MKFQLSPAPGCAGSYRKETSVRRSGGLQAAVRAKGSEEKDFGLEAKATFANEDSGQYPGRRTVKVLPWPGSLLNSIRPLWASTIRLTMANPRPLPWDFLFGSTR